MLTCHLKRWSSHIHFDPEGKLKAFLQPQAPPTHMMRSSNDLFPQRSKDNAKDLMPNNHHPVDAETPIKISLIFFAPGFFRGTSTGQCRISMFFLALIYFPIETGSSLKPHCFIQEAMITIALPHCQTSLPDPETNSYCSTASLHLKMNGLEDDLLVTVAYFQAKNC